METEEVDNEGSSLTFSVKEWTMGLRSDFLNEGMDDGVSTLHYLNEGVDDGGYTLHFLNEGVYDGGSLHFLNEGVDDGCSTPLPASSCSVALQLIKNT